MIFTGEASRFSWGAFRVKMELFGVSVTTFYLCGDSLYELDAYSISIKTNERSELLCRQRFHVIAVYIHEIA